MDNFFEILIYLFIIVSFVNSFLKKKKKNENKADTTQQAQTEIPRPVFEEKRQEPSGKDILEEIQNLFNPPVNDSKDENESFGDLWKTDSYKEHYEKADYHKPTSSEHKVTMSEHTPSYSEHNIPGREYKSKRINLKEDIVDEKILENYNQIQYTGRATDPFLQKLKMDFKDKDTLKRYIVVSEILGKPKALRR